MDGAAGVLVIILAVFLAIFLILSIVLLILLIKISRQIKTVAGTVQRTTDGIERSISNFTMASTPLALARIIKNVVKVNKPRK